MIEFTSNWCLGRIESPNGTIQYVKKQFLMHFNNLENHSNGNRMIFLPHENVQIRLFDFLKIDQSESTKSENR